MLRVEIRFYSRRVTQMRTLLHHKAIDSNKGSKQVRAVMDHNFFTKVICKIKCEGRTYLQARRQNSVTGRAEINFGGAREVFFCEFERGTGAREIYFILDQMNKVKTKDSEGFSGQNQKLKRFFRPRTGDLQKKRSSSQKCHVIRCQSTKITKIPVANTNFGLD